jgi:methylated-DNA-[protein]-cysteine S-methyltransferase
MQAKRIMKAAGITLEDEPPRYRLIPTAMGWVWYAAGEEGVVKMQLPVATRAAALREIEAFDGAMREDPKLMPRLAKALESYFAGKPAAFDVPLDQSRIPEFFQRVYDELRRVPRGVVLTYGELARRAGSPGAARSVGTALSRNPFPPIVPCHRVVGGNGSVGGFSAPTGLVLKTRMLEIEGLADRAAIRRAAESR